MPSPLAHSAVSYLIYRAQGQSARPRTRAAWWILGAALFFSFLPDLDTVPGVLFADFGKYHNNLTHSLFTLAAVALLGGGALPATVFGAYSRRVGFVALCYGSHLLLDYFTVGRGLMLFWPLTDARYQAPIKLFTGVHWAHAWRHPGHLWTLANELLFIGALALGWRLWRRWRRAGAERSGCAQS